MNIDDFEKQRKMKRISLLIYIGEDDHGDEFVITDIKGVRDVDKNVDYFLEQENDATIQYGDLDEPIMLRSSYRDTDKTITISNIKIDPPKLNGCVIVQPGESYIKVKHQENNVELENVEPEVEISENGFADEVKKRNPAKMVFGKSKRKQALHNHKIKRPIEDWKANDFLKYMHEQYVKTYGTISVTFNKYAKGMITNSYAKLFTVIKRELQDVFKLQGLDNDDLKKYIDWMFKVKSKQLDFPITLSTLMWPTTMDEWVFKEKNKSYIRPLSRQDVAKYRIKK